MSFPFYKQPDYMDCGPTCLRMVAKYYGKAISLQELRELAQTTREGSSILGISNAAEKIGFRTLGVKVTFEQMVEDATFPCIAYWNQQHFVVVHKIKNDTISVADPSHGLLKYTKAEFLKSWVGDGHKGILLLLEPSPEFDEEEVNSDKAIVKPRGFSFLFKYLFRYKKLLVQLVISLLAGSLPRLLCQRRRLGRRDRAEDELSFVVQPGPGGQARIRLPAQRLPRRDHWRAGRDRCGGVPRCLRPAADARPHRRFARCAPGPGQRVARAGRPAPRAHRAARPCGRPHHRAAGAVRRRHGHARALLPARRAGAVRRVRYPPHCRRDRGGLRAQRHLLRLRASRHLA